MLRYHHAIIDLLGANNAPSHRRREAIARREQLCGASFPASVVEWFSLEGADTLFYDNTNSDHLAVHTDLGDPAEAAQGYLCVATENQSVIAWYVRLDEGDDPPVYANNDEWDGPPAGRHWQRISETFSNFIFDLISNGYFRGWYSGLRWEADDRMPNAEDLGHLARSFYEGSTTDVPGSRVFRFYSRSGVIAACSVTPEQIAEGRAHWSVEARTPEALLDFGRRLWTVGTLVRTLRPMSCSAASRAEGEQVLRTLRAEADPAAPGGAGG